MVTKKQKQRNLTILVLVAVALLIFGVVNPFAVSSTVRVCEGDCIFKQDCNPCQSGETATNCFYSPSGQSSLNTFSSVSNYCNAIPANPIDWGKQCTCVPDCTPNADQECYSGDVYWFDSCGNRGNLVDSCQFGCSGGQCEAQQCVPNSERRCYSGSVYYFDSCGNRGSLAESCSFGCSNNQCSPEQCTPNAQQDCFGGDVYSFDSCGTLGSLVESCVGGCSNGQCEAQQDCSFGEVKCEQSEYFTCGSFNTWETQGVVLDKCNVECLADTDCDEGSSCDVLQNTCVAGEPNNILITILWVGGGVVVIGILTFFLLKGGKKKRRRRR